MSSGCARAMVGPDSSFSKAVVTSIWDYGRRKTGYTL
jgi:hypothetical protein